MKCVCPMGGNRTCPDDCLLAIWAGLSSTDRKTQRKSVAEKLYGQGFTMEQIATQLGVSKMQISRDLSNCNIGLQLKPAKTATNPRGAGRPKGSKKSQAPRPHYKEDEVTALADAGKTQAEIAAKTGVGKRQVRHLVERHNIKLSAEAQIDPSSLSLTAQEKLEAAIRQHKHRLDQDFFKRVNERVDQRINEYWLPEHKKLITDAKQWAERRKGIMNKATFDKIRRCLHPDSRNTATERRLAEAFDAFMALENKLLDEKDSPTTVASLPDNIQEWDRMRHQSKMKRSNNSMSRR